MLKHESEAVLCACSLLAVGFGDAGAEVIANNIRSGGDLNPMIPGNKVVAIFGFCDIRNFTDTTEVLQEDIMEFVNSIADIVHTEVGRAGHNRMPSRLGICHLDGHKAGAACMASSNIKCACMQQPAASSGLQHQGSCHQGCGHNCQLSGQPPSAQPDACGYKPPAQSASLHQLTSCGCGCRWHCMGAAPTKTLATLSCWSGSSLRVSHRGSWHACCQQRTQIWWAATWVCTAYRVCIQHGLAFQAAVCPSLMHHLLAVTSFGFIRTAQQLGLPKPGSLKADSDFTDCMHSC